MAIQYKVLISEKQRKLIMRALTTAVANNRRLTSGGVLNDDEWMGLIAVFANPQAADDLPGQSYISGEGWGRAKTKLGVELGRSIACGSLICPRLLLLPQRATMQTPQGFDAKHHRWVVSHRRELCCALVAQLPATQETPGPKGTGVEILALPEAPAPPQHKTSNAQQRRRHKALMRNTTGGLFPNQRPAPGKVWMQSAAWSVTTKTGLG